MTTRFGLNFETGLRGTNNGILHVLVSGWKNNHSRREWKTSVIRLDKISVSGIRRHLVGHILAVQTLQCGLGASGRWSRNRRTGRGGLDRVLTSIASRAITEACLTSCTAVRRCASAPAIGGAAVTKARSCTSGAAVGATARSIRGDLGGWSSSRLSRCLSGRANNQGRAGSLGWGRVATAACSKGRLTAGSAMVCRASTLLLLAEYHVSSEDLTYPSILAAAIAEFASLTSQLS
jgi:hypothetical protein